MVGCVYSMIGFVHLSVSVINYSGRYGNVSCKSWIFDGLGCCFIWSYSVLYLGGIFCPGAYCGIECTDVGVLCVALVD